MNLQKCTFIRFKKIFITSQATADNSFHAYTYILLSNFKINVLLTSYIPTVYTKKFITLKI